MEIEEAYQHVARSYPGEPGRFFEPGSRLDLGKGCIYCDALFAAFDENTARFQTAQGTVYVLTHECDVDAGNERLFNTDVLVCPLMPLQDVVAEYSAELPPDVLVSFLTNLGARNISRLAYLPPIRGHLPYGSVMYLNQITHSPVNEIRARAALVCSVSGFGLREIEYVLENHLLRPKADRLAFVPIEAAGGPD
jgi:hypothetical protein